MGLIWSSKNLENLTRHQNPLVRGWAIERMTILYPEMAGDVAMRLITDKDDSISRTAIKYFITHPDKKYVPGLLGEYGKSSGNMAALITQAIVRAKDTSIIPAFAKKYGSSNCRHDLRGYAISVFHIAGLHSSDSKKIAQESLKIFNTSGDDVETILNSIIGANLIAGTDISILLDLAFRHADSAVILGGLLTAICRHCGSGYNEDDLSEGKGKGPIQSKIPPLVRECLEDLKEQGFKDSTRVLEKLFRKRKYDRIIREIHDWMNILLDKRREQTGKHAFDLWQKGNGRPRQNISAINAFYESMGESRKGSMELIAKSALTIFASLLDFAQLIGVNIDRMDAEGLLNIFLQERYDVEEDERIMEMLSSLPEREKIIHTCLNHIDKDPFSIACPRIVDFLSDIMDDPIAGRLIRIDTEQYELWDRLIEGIAGLGSTAVTIVKPFFKEPVHRKVDYALRILNYIPADDSVEIILKHWNPLWENNKETLLAAVRGIGDRRFIAPLKNELKVGETDEGEIYYLLCLINNVMDSDLKKIKKEIEKNKKKTEQRINKFLEGDMEGLLGEPMELQLRCLRCRKEYHYQVEKVLIDDSGSNYIMDDIRCKNCGAVNHYEITPKGHLSITSSMMLMLAISEKKKQAPDNCPISIAKFKAIDGKKISMKEAIPYYEKKLENDPKNVAYILGYANTLRNAKRTDDAIPLYETAIQYDPMAVEAYVALAQIAEIGEDLRKAYHYYERASEIINRGNYYKVSMDLDDFKEATLDHFLGVSKRLGKGIRFHTEKGAPTMVKRKKVGRNAPCPCGSGKKYKKCCLGRKAGESPERPSPDNAEKWLMERVFKYSLNMPKTEFIDASALYWGIEPEEPLVVPEEVLSEGGAFMEWYTHDYLLSSGKTILEEYYSSHFKRLTSHEREILQSHMQACPGIYEVLEVSKGIGIKLKDVFTGKVLDVKEVSGSYQVVKWDFLMVRVYQLNGVRRFVGVGSILPRQSVRGLKDFLLHEFEKFKKEPGRREWKDFMKKYSYRVEHYMKNLPEKKPLFLTPEGHGLILSKARFHIRDFDRVIDILYEENDFALDGLAPHKEAKLTWLKKGESKEWETVKTENGMMIDSKFVHESGKLSWDILGSMKIDRKSLTLECISKERLERGKKRLNNLLKGHIEHKIDTFQDVEATIDRNRRQWHDEEGELDSRTQLLMESMMHQKFADWVDERIPALDGMTPREAVRSVEKKNKVLEIVKDMENMEERKKIQGMSYVDISFVKEELGIQSPV